MLQHGQVERAVWKLRIKRRISRLSRNGDRIDMSRRILLAMLLQRDLPVEALHLCFDFQISLELMEPGIEGNQQAGCQEQHRVQQQKLTFHGAASVSGSKRKSV